MTRPACYICGDDRDVESHHLIPQATGGRDLPTIDLCGTCHSLVHKAAVNIVSKQPNRQFFPETQQKRAAKVVRFIVLAIQRERENPNASNPYSLQLPLTKGAVALLHVLKADAGFTNLQAYIRALLQREIDNRFGRRTNPEQTKKP